MRELEKLFARYYRSMASTIYVSDVPLREFMFRDFEGKVRRHISFRDLSELRKYLIDNPPMHAYYSVSLYRNPTAPMAEKEPIRAELLFDIDSTDFKDEECERESIWRCKNCGLSGKGIPPGKCPKCGSKRMEVNHWLNERCISLTKKEVGKLIEVLSEDLGASLDEIAVSYTGNRGFHVRVSEGKLTTLSKEGRREVAFYAMGRGFDPTFLFMVERGLVRLDLRSSIARRALEHLLSAHVKLAPSIREKVLLLSKGMGIKLGSRERKRLLNLLKESAQSSGARIDWMVTMDTGRLTRIPNSVHGKTGFRALRLSLDEYEVFNPFKDAVGLPSEPEIKVRVKMPVPAFRLKDEAFGPYSPGEEVQLPGFAAAFVILRGRAEPLNH
ncbi:MAG: DNA primase small subunit domain-containing protein [Candidatus Korarchaeota archaeon]|nr:DNA primase small subunit domain-containing protein [Candidatus Korarchaeota archaeon]